MEHWIFELLYLQTGSPVRLLSIEQAEGIWVHFADLSFITHTKVGNKLPWAVIEFDIKVECILLWRQSEIFSARHQTFSIKILRVLHLYLKERINFIMKILMQHSTGKCCHLAPIEESNVWLQFSQMLKE